MIVDMDENLERLRTIRGAQNDVVMQNLRVDDILNDETEFVSRDQVEELEPV